MSRSITTSKRVLSPRALAALVLLLLPAGCGQMRDVPSEYARERMTGSIHGLEVLTDLLKEQKCSIRSYVRLSPSLKQQDVLIWFPDDVAEPPHNALWFLEDWLSRSPNRLVIFVGRDYDAGVDYWSKVIGQLPPEQREIATRRLAEARQRGDLARAQAGKAFATPWFRFENSSKVVRLTNPEGPWAQGVDFSKAEVAYQSKLLPPGADIAEGELYDPDKHNPAESIFGEEADEPEKASAPPSAPAAGESTEAKQQPSTTNPFRMGRTLLAEGGVPFAFEVVSNRFPGSRIVVLQNARFLVNYGLVNPEHRKLAAHLLAEIPPSSKVALLHSDKGGPKVYWGQIQAEKAKPDEVLRQTLVLLQITLPVLFLLFVLYPVFGRARDLPRTQISDFGKHIEAIGALLQKGGDERYAWSRVFAYQQQFRRESGTRHAAKAGATAQRTIVIQIAAVALGPGRSTELGTGQWLENNIASRKIGKVALKMSQPLCLEIQVEVEDAEFARTAIEALLREARLYEQSTIFIR